MVVVDLTMDPTDAESPISSSTDTHTTARIAVATVYSNSTTTVGQRGLKVGFDGSGEYKSIIYGRLPEKKDVLGETGDKDAAIVGMKLNFTINANDIIALHYAISDFDVKLDSGISGTNGYQFADMVRICWDGIDHDSTSGAVTQGWFKGVETDKSPLNITDSEGGNFGNIEVVGGPIKGEAGDFGFGANGIIAYFRPDTADVDFSIDMNKYVKSKSLKWGDYFSFIIQRMDNDEVASADHITFKQLNNAGASRTTVNAGSGGTADHSTGFDIIIQYEDKEPTRPVTTLTADTDMISAVVNFKTRPSEVDIKEFRTVWKADYDSTSDATIETGADTVNGIKGVTYSTNTTYSAATANLGKETLKQADGDITATFLALEGTDNTYALTTYASDQNNNTMGNLMTHYRLRAAGGVVSSGPTVGEEVTLTVLGYKHSSNSTAANFVKFGVNWDGGATAANDSLDDYDIITLDEPASSTTIKHVFDKADSTTYVNIFVVDALGFRSNMIRATSVNVSEGTPVAVLRASRDTAIRATYGDEFSVINLSLAHSYPVGSDRVIMGYQFKHNSSNPITTHPTTNDNSNFNDVSNVIKLKCVNLANVGTASSGTMIKVFGKVSVTATGTPIADNSVLFDHYEHQVHTVMPHVTDINVYGDEAADDGSDVYYKSVDFVIIQQLDPQDVSARAGLYVLADGDGNVINDKICGQKDTYEWGGHRELSDNMTEFNISNSETITRDVGSGDFFTNGAVVGDKIYLSEPENAENNGFYTLSGVAADRLDVIESISTTNAEDTTAEIFKVNGPTLPIASLAGGYTPTITARVISVTSGTSDADEKDNSAEVTQVLKFEDETYHSLDLDTLADAGHIAIQSANLSRSGGISSQMALGGKNYPIGTTRTSMGMPTLEVTVRALTQTGYRSIWNLIEGDRYEWATIDSKKVDTPDTAYKQLRMRLSNGSINKDPAMASQYTASLSFIIIGELVS